MNNTVFAQSTDYMSAIKKVENFDKALSYHLFCLCQRCREQGEKWKSYISKAQKVDGRYVVNKSHLSFLRGRVSGLTDGLVVLGVICQSDADIICDYALI